MLVVGAALAYLAVLAMGPNPYIGCVSITTMSGWFTVLLLPLAAAPAVADNWLQSVDRRTRVG